MKARDLRGKKKEELTKQLDEQKTELASLQVWLFHWLVSEQDVEKVDGRGGGRGKANHSALGEEHRGISSF